MEGMSEKIFFRQHLWLDGALPSFRKPETVTKAVRQKGILLAMETKMTGLDFKIREMAARIRELREITQLTAEEMAQKTDVTIEEYLACENGKSDLNFAFIYRCALAFGVDVTDIIEGVSPTLKSYTVTRSGAGQKIEQAHGMTYFNLASAFRNRIAEPD